MYDPVLKYLCKDAPAEHRPLSCPSEQEEKFDDSWLTEWDSKHVYILTPGTIKGAMFVQQYWFAVSGRDKMRTYTFEKFSGGIMCEGNYRIFRSQLNGKTQPNRQWVAYALERWDLREQDAFLKWKTSGGIITYQKFSSKRAWLFPGNHYLLDVLSRAYADNSTIAKECVRRYESGEPFGDADLVYMCRLQVLDACSVRSLDQSNSLLQVEEYLHSLTTIERTRCGGRLIFSVQGRRLELGDTSLDMTDIHPMLSIYNGDDQEMTGTHGCLAVTSGNVVSVCECICT